MTSNKLIREGNARIYITLNGYRAFYNPLAKLNRSLGVAIVSSIGSILNNSLKVADALAATGIRGIRYAIETNVVERVHFNDKSKNACKIIEKNIHLNNIAGISQISNMDANLFLFEYRFVFNFIDVDPFGTPSPFMDSAIASVREGGVVALTATDLAALCGLYKFPSLRKYGSLSIHTEYSKEIGLRILIKELMEAAGRHMRYGEIISAHVINQYARVYVRVREGKKQYPHEYIGYLLHNIKNNNIKYVRMDKLSDIISDIKGSNDFLIAGPLWIGPLHNINYLDEALNLVKSGNALAESDRKIVIKYLGIFKEEANMPPFHYNVHKACKKLKRSVPRVENIIDELRSMGYLACKTHFNGTCIKTNAPYTAFLDLLRDL